MVTHRFKRLASSAVWIWTILILRSGDVQIQTGPRSDQMVSSSIYYQNCQSLVNNLDDCAAHVNEFTTFDFIALTEIWLTSYTLSHNIPFSYNFEIHRKDRNRRGGGILLGVNFNFKYPFRRRMDLECKDCELLWVEVNYPIKPLFIGGVLSSS
jgi:hypothetical protein